MVSSQPSRVTRPMFPWRKRGLLSYGLPFSDLLAAHVTELGSRRIFVLISGSLARNTDILSTIESLLGTKLVDVQVGFPSHVPWDHLLALARRIGDSKADTVVTVGGGSITDAVKLSGLILSNGLHDFKSLDAMSQRLRAVMWHDIDYKYTHADPPDVKGPPFTMINIPTTLSAGEFSPYAGGIDPTDGVKKIFVLETLATDIVILDPEVARHTPEWVWMSSGVRSIDHCVELLGSLNDKIEPQTEEAAENGLILVARGLLKLRRDPDDDRARLETQVGSNFAMDGLCRGVHLGGSHAIGHQLGTMNVAHGHTSCVLLPSVNKFNAAVNGHRQERAKDCLWGDEYIRQVLSKRGLSKENDLGDLLDGLFRECGMPRSLKEVGVAGEENLQMLASRSLQDPWCRTNPIPLNTSEQVMAILRLVEG